MMAIQHSGFAVLMLFGGEGDWQSGLPRRREAVSGVRGVNRRLGGSCSQFQI
jgi:hypothetical protein